MQLFARDPDSWDDETASAETCAPLISQMVDRRRGADKLNHFERLHDVLPFIEFVFRTNSSHAAVEQFCKLFLEHRFDADAAARAFHPLKPWRSVLGGW